MEKIKTVLAVVSSRDDGEIVLEKAVHIARANEAALHVIKVIYEGFVELSVHEVEKSRELKAWVMQAEEAFLEDLIDPWRNQIPHLESATLWHKSEWEGILDMVGELRADLIIKPTEYPVNEVIRTPADWNLLRHSDVPVMLVKPINWPDKPSIAACLDATNKNEEELNIRILREASQLADTFGSKLDIITAFPSVEHWVGPITVVIDFDRVREAMANEVQYEIRKLTERIDVRIDQVHALEGDIGHVIGKQLDECDTEILVMGTRSRHGPLGAVLGNTSEAIIHKVNTDVVVLR